MGWKYRQRREHCLGKGLPLFRSWDQTSHGYPGAEDAAASAARLKVVSFPRWRPSALNHPSLSSLFLQPFPHRLSALLISLPHPQPCVLK